MFFSVDSTYAIPDVQSQSIVGSDYLTCKFAHPTSRQMTYIPPFVIGVPFVGRNWKAWGVYGVLPFISSSGT